MATQKYQFESIIIIILILSSAILLWHDFPFFSKNLDVEAVASPRAVVTV